MGMQFFSKYFQILEQMPLSLEEWHAMMIEILPEYAEVESEVLLEILLGLHAPLYRIYDACIATYIDTTTKNQNIEDSKLCFVDIETTAGNPEDGQIIEIGALMTQNGKILDKFNTFVYSPFVPETIVELTGIESYMLEDAPRIEQVLRDFRAFLGDSIFVAHNVAFDYNFIADSLCVYNMPPLFNARLCTLDLSRKVILSKKHALAHLNTMLGINTAQMHRAYDDALTSFELYKICLPSLPKEVVTIQNLIDFSKGKITYPKRATSKTKLTKSTTKYMLALDS